MPCPADLDIKYTCPVRHRDRSDSTLEHPSAGAAPSAMPPTWCDSFPTRLGSQKAEVFTGVFHLIEEPVDLRLQSTLFGPLNPSPESPGHPVPLSRGPIAFRRFAATRRRRYRIAELAVPCGKAHPVHDERHPDAMMRRNRDRTGDSDKACSQTLRPQQLPSESHAHSPRLASRTSRGNQLGVTFPFLSKHRKRILNR